MRKKTKNYNKILVSYKIDEQTVMMFRSTSAFNGDNMSEVIEKYLKYYIKANRPKVEEKMKVFFDYKKKPDPNV